MKLEEVIEEISEKIEVDIKESSLVRKINQVQKELFRQVKEKTVSKWDLLKGQAGYPVTFPESSIILVNVDGNDYTLLPLVYENKNRYYTYMDSSIILYPTPDKTVTEGLYVYHFKSPYELTTGDMEKEPDLDSDYHMLLVYGVLKDFEERYEKMYDRLFFSFKRSRISPALLEMRIGDRR